MMKKEMNMSPVYEVITTNFGAVYYQGVNQTDALICAQQTGFECTVNKDNKLFASYSPISGMKYYSK
jgi:hypothetical protein